MHKDVMVCQMANAPDKVITNQPTTKHKKASRNPCCYTALLETFVKASIATTQTPQHLPKHVHEHILSLSHTHTCTHACMCTRTHVHTHTHTRRGNGQTKNSSAGKNSRMKMSVHIHVKQACSPSHGIFTHHCNTLKQTNKIG